MSTETTEVQPDHAETFSDSVERFLGSASWLTDEDEPMVTSLILMAKQLDKRFSAATMAQFGLSYRYLCKKRPDGGSDKDPLEALLDGE